MAVGPGPSGAPEGPWGAGLTAPGPAVQRWGPGLLLCRDAPLGNEDRWTGRIPAWKEEYPDKAVFPLPRWMGPSGELP